MRVRDYIVGALLRRRRRGVRSCRLREEGTIVPSSIAESIRMGGRPVWHAWYDTAKWRAWSQHWLREHPLCAFCEIKNKVTAAAICDHKVAHKGDPRLFWDSTNLQSLCRPCHESMKKQVESRGYSTEVGLDGYPVDHRHPWYQAKCPSRASRGATET
jgi:5-methylcytosine-specific restriction protein A